MSLDKRFLPNIIRNSYAVTIVIGAALYLLKAHLPEKFAEGFTYGAVCGTTNLVFLSIVIRSTIKGNGKTGCAGLTAGGLGLIAVVAAYCYVFVKGWFDDIAMVVGFSFVFCVIFISAIEKVFKKPKRGSVG